MTAPILSAAADAGITVEMHEFSLTDPSCGLATNRTDVAFTYLPLEVEIDVVPIYTDQRVLAMASTHEWATRTSIAIEEIRTVPVIVSECSDRAWQLSWTLEDAGSPRTPDLVVKGSGSLEGHLAIIASGRCVMATSDRVSRELPRPGLTYVPITGATEAQFVAAKRHDDDRPAISLFMDAVRRVVHDSESSIGG